MWQRVHRSTFFVWQKLKEEGDGRGVDRTVDIIDANIRFNHLHLIFVQAEYLFVDLQSNIHTSNLYFSDSKYIQMIIMMNDPNLKDDDTSEEWRDPAETDYKILIFPPVSSSSFMSRGFNLNIKYV